MEWRSVLTDRLVSHSQSVIPNYLFTIISTMSIDQINDSSSDMECDGSFDSGYSSLCLIGSPPPSIFFFSSFQLVPVEGATLIPQVVEPVTAVATQHVGYSKHRLIKWSLPPPPARAALLPGWTPMPYGLETFWQSAFAWFFRPMWIVHDHLWTMEPTELAPSSTEWPWHATTYSAKIRFRCNVSANHGWTSKKGRVVFWYRIRRQGEQIICQVLFKLYGQQCNRCMQQTLAQQSEYLVPLWYPEEIENAVRSLSVAVIDSYYGGCSPIDRKPIKRIRVTKPTKNSQQHHDPIRCQACHDGFCVTSGFFA